MKLSTSKLDILINLEDARISISEIDSIPKLIEQNGFHQTHDTCVFDFQLDQGEYIYGAGFRALPMNRRGYRLAHFNQPRYGYGYGTSDLNYSIPHILSSNNYMLLFDNPAKGYLDIGKTDSNLLSFQSLGGNQSYYFINGETPMNLIKSYVELTGSQELPPLWAFGNLQSRFGYRNQAQADSILSQTINAGFPVDAIIIDLYWFSKDARDGRMGNLSWDREEWPDPEGMIQSFKDKGVQTVLVSEPFFVKTSNHFKYLSDNKLLGLDSTGNTLLIKDFFFGEAGLIDLFNPKAKDWFWNQYKKQKEYGIAGWWGDLGEPEKHPDTMIHHTGTAIELHGLYGHEWVKMLYEKTKNEYPDERFFKLGRAGFAGSQRYGLIPWTGDVGRSWSGLKAQIPAMLGMGISGLGYMHSDAGGFSMGDLDTLLYIRWMQFATFTPIFRPHGDAGVGPTEVALWDEEVQNILRPYLELRYQLMPYIYSAAWENYQSGLPLTTPLFFHYQEDPDALKAEFQYFFGPSLMIAPVLNGDAEYQEIYLPEGKWYNFWDQTAYAGPSRINYELEIEELPVFVRAGSFVNMGSLYKNSTQYATDTLWINYYALNDKGDVSSDIYIDDGKSKEYQDGFYDLIQIQSSEDTNGLTYSISKSGKSFENAPNFRILKFKIIGLERRPEYIKANHKPQEFVYEEGQKFSEFSVSFESTLDISIKLINE